MSAFSVCKDRKGIVDGTSSFFTALLNKDFHVVEDYLSPDCRLQDQFGEGRGVTGSDKCMDKIKEVAGKLKNAGLTKMESVGVMRNLRQVRFMLHGKLGFMKISIGFAVEWSGGIINLLVIVKNAVDKDFLKDGTSAPPAPPPAEEQPPPEASNRTDVASALSGQSTEPSGNVDSDRTSAVVGVEAGGSDAPQCTPVHTEEPVTTVESKRGKGKEDMKSDKWYPGKYLQQRRLSTSVGTHSPQNPYWAHSRPGDYEVVMQSLGVTLQPPFLIPRPPAVPASVTVTVESASQLKSRLVRLVTRPVNSYVTVSVGGRSRSTPVVPKSSFPNYATSCPNGENIFIFELPNSQEFRRDGCIEFTIKDKNLRDEDVLAEVVLPIVSIKCKMDHSAPTRLQLPVEQFSKHRTRLGKGFQKRRSESAEARKSDDLSLLNISISKVDIMLWWVLEEIRARDEAREKAIAEEKLRKALEAERKLAEELDLNRGSESNNGKLVGKKTKPARKVLADVPRYGGAVLDESDWADGDTCHGCKVKFSLTVWKHHCRLCGQVFCDPCSSGQVSDTDGNMMRACASCKTSAQEEALTEKPPIAKVAPGRHRTPDSDDELDIVDNHAHDKGSGDIDATPPRVSDGSARTVSAVSENSEEEDDDDEMACVIS